MAIFNVRGKTQVVSLVGAVVTPETVKTFRQERGWTAFQLGVELGGYTRSYIKSIEGGSLPVSDRFRARFVNLQSQVLSQAMEIESRYRLPRVFEIEARPRCCKVCRKWKIFSVPWQKVCRRCKK